MFKRILVANRGEIALRVIRACHDLGIEAVAVFSEADRGAAYLEVADLAVCIGPAPAAESYLYAPRLIAAAEATDSQAIHPGYGFLSENAKFNEMCRDCNITFIGPPPEAMDRLGNKNQARKLAQSAGVPVVPGSEGLISPDADVSALARRIGFPVLIKAAAGGGGRGMRVVRSEAEVAAAASSARQEAEAAFTAASIWSVTSIGHVISRCNYWATSTATWCICGNGIARCNGVIKSWSRNHRLRICPRRSALPSVSRQ
jgi:acetyl-CoA carboxylase biotin carboxylase subunit